MAEVMPLTSIVSPGRVAQAAQLAAGFGQAPREALVQIQQIVAQELAAKAAVAVRDGAGASGLARRAAVALRAPTGAWATTDSTGEGGSNGHVRLALLTAQLMEVLDQGKQQTLEERQKLAQVSLDARKRLNEQRSAALQQAQAAADEAQAAAEAAGASAEEAWAAAEAARAEVERLEAELAGLEPGTPEYEALATQLQQARGQHAQLVGQAEQAQAAAVAAAQDCNAALQALEQARDQALAGRHLEGGLVLANAEDGHARVARLEGLLAQLAQLINKSSLEKLKTETTFALSQLEARRAENQRRSEEYQEQVEKAKQMEKTMGCIGKVLGWVVTAVFVALAPFSGGTSMALAAVTLSLVAADAVTDGAVTKAVIEPVMTAVLKPIIDVLTKVYGGVLKGLGVDPSVADQIAQVAATIVATVALLVIVVAVGRGVATSKLAAKAGELVSKRVSQMIPQMLKTATKDIATGASKMMSSAPSWAQRSAHFLKHTAAPVALTVLPIAQAGVQAGGQVAVAARRVEAAEVLARLQLGQADARLIEQFLEEALKQFKARNELVLVLIEKMSESAAQHAESGRFVVGNFKPA